MFGNFDERGDEGEDSIGTMGGQQYPCIRFSLYRPQTRTNNILPGKLVHTLRIIYDVNNPVLVRIIVAGPSIPGLDPDPAVTVFEYSVDIQAGYI